MALGPESLLLHIEEFLASALGWIWKKKKSLPTDPNFLEQQIGNKHFFCLGPSEILPAFAG